MKIHYFQHVPFEGLGSIAAWAQAAGCRVTVSRLFMDDPIPGPHAYDGLVVMGGPMNIYEEDRYPFLKLEKQAIIQAVEKKKAVLGICLGAQLIADVLGAKVTPNPVREIGWFPVSRTPNALKSAFSDVWPETFTAFHWHGDTFGLPPGAVHLARSAACEHQAFIAEDRILGLQFHLETTPESASDLIHHCADEIAAGGPWIQGAPDILSDGKHFTEANRIMARVMDRLFLQSVR